MAFTAFALNCASFSSLKVFPILLQRYDLHGCLMIYGFGSLASAIFILVVMRETNGQSLDDVGADGEKMKVERARVKSITSL